MAESVFFLFRCMRPACFSGYAKKSDCTGQKAGSGTPSLCTERCTRQKLGFLIKTSFKKGKEPLTYGTE